MRKKKLLFRLLALVACLACALGASAYDFQSGGFYYNITGDRTVELTSSSSGTQASDYQDSVINIPSMTSNAGVVYQVKAIGTKAFYCNSNIKSLTIPNSVITIGDNAFFNCTQLKSLTMGNSVTSIGGYAFYGCVGLTSVTIPNSVITIGNDAFFNCNKLESVMMGNSVKTIGDYAFYVCSKLTNVNFPSSVTSIGSKAFFNCKMKNVTLSNAMAYIGSEAFSVCDSLESVTIIGNGETIIAAEAFRTCSSLKRVTIGSGVDSIGTYAFGYCRALSDLTIENGLKSIGRNSFYNCPALTSLTIPNSVVSIGDYAFYNCQALTSLTIPNSVTSIGNHVFNGCSALTRLTIPNSVTSIGNYAFNYCSALASLTIGNSVTSIGDYAFNDCSALTHLTIPASVTIIGQGAFRNCSGLTSIKVVDGNPVWDSRNNCNAIIETSSNGLLMGCMNTIIPDDVAFIGDVAFSGCSGLKSITIPNSVSMIGSSAFSGCTGLKSITIPNSVSQIGNYAFSGCTGLTSVTIGSRVQSMGSYTFSNCHAILRVNSLAHTPPSSGGWIFESSVRENALLCVPSGCKEAYRESNYWKDFMMSEFVYDFEMNGIYYAITGDRTVAVVMGPYSGDINIPTMTSYMGTVYRVTSIAHEAFWRSSGVTSVTIPGSVTSIDNNAFTECSGLTSITIPQSVTSIGYVAFAGCSGLTSINVASGNTVYDSRDNCNAIIETATNRLLVACINTVIPNTVTTIGDYAFYNTAITSVTIPNSVTSIEGGAFMSCSALKSVICLATTPPHIEVGSIFGTFEDNTYENGTLYVPQGCKSVYQAADGWKDFSTFKELTYDFMVNGICYTITGDNTVEVCENPTLYSGDLVVPISVTYDGKTYQVTGIGDYAFEGCTGLTRITIPSSVTYIGDAAFSNCGLVTLTIPNSVTTIGWFAFSYCNALSSVTIGASVTSIGEYAFTSCPNLNSVTCLGTTPPTILDDVFDADCYSRAWLRVPSGAVNAYRPATGWRNFTHVMTFGTKGDVNNDGQVNITDVTVLISAIMAESISSINADNADMNGDGNVNITDVTSLINKIMSAN